MATKVVVSFEVDNAGAVSKIQQVKRELNDVPQSTAKATSGFITLKQALVGVASSFVAIKLGQFMRESIQGAIEEQQVMTRLAATLANVGVRYRDVAVELSAFFEKIQATTRFSDDEAAAAFQRLVIITGDYGTAMKLLGPVLDMAVGGTMDLETAAMLAGKAATGFTGILERQIGRLDESTKAQLSHASAAERVDIIYKALMGRFGGQAQADVKSYAGQVLQLANAWDNLKETIGAALLGMVQTRDGTFKLIEALGWLRNIIIESSAGWKLMIDSTWLMAKAYFEAMTNAVHAFGENLKREWAIAFSAGPFGLNAPGAGTRSITAALAEFSRTMDELEQQITESAIWAVADMERYRIGIQNLDSDVGHLADTVGGGAGGGEGLAEALSKLTERIYTALHTAQNRLIAYNDNVTDEILERWRELYVVEFPEVIVDAVEATGPAYQEMADNSYEILAGSFSDLLGKGFMGELDSFADLWDEIWQDLAKSMVGIIGDALEKILSGEGTFADLFENLKGNLATLIAGVGMLYGAFEQGRAGNGGTGSIVQGALGGAMAGAYWGPIGMAVGAVIGGAIAAWGNSLAENPETLVRTLGLDTGSIDTRGHQGYTTELRELWIKQQQSIMRSYIQGYRQLLLLFEDRSLFELIGATPTFDSSGWMGMGADQLAQWLQNEYWPSAFMTMFQDAISAGLEGLGVSSGTLDQLWAELEALPGEERMGALTTYVSSLVNLTKLMADMDWNAIMDVVGADSMTTFMSGIEQIAGSIETLMFALDDMTLLERAEQAQQIEDLIVQVRQAEIQYLQQLDSLQKSINASIASQIEGLQLGDMGDEQRRSYYQQRIAEIMAQLRGGGVTSPEQLQQLMADLQRYIQALAQGLGDQLFEPMDIMGWGQTWVDFLSEILQEAQGYSDAYFEEFRDEIRTANDELIAAIRDLIEALTGVPQDDGGDGIPPYTGGSPWGDLMQSPWGGGGQPQVNVYLDGSMSALRPMVRAEIRDSLAGRPRGIN